MMFRADPAHVRAAVAEVEELEQQPPPPSQEVLTETWRNLSWVLDLNPSVQDEPLGLDKMIQQSLLLLVGVFVELILIGLVHGLLD